MKNANIKRIALTLGIAFVSAFTFFLFQLFIRQVSMPVAIIAAGILFVLIGSLPICFFLADKLTEKRDRKDKIHNKTDEK